MRIAFTTLGCKINQYETSLLRQDLLSRGNTIVPFDAEADVYIVNTCSVTAKADMQCRQLIRSATRRGGNAKVVVTGCYAQTQPEEIKKIPGVDLVIGNREKSVIPARIMSHIACRNELDTSRGKPVPIQAIKERTRGFLKIQDGCNNHCTYCVVPLARGDSRSASLESVVGEFDRLVREGCPEIVLTGIHVGTYGIDLSQKSNLSDLIALLVSKRGQTRIRLSSIEPREITDGMIRMLGHGLCRHLHIPLQSGDDTILSAMERDYTSGFYLDLLTTIAEQVPGMALGADVMVGFPGEGDKEFQNTVNLIEKSPLTHLHVFSYSPRPGTVAADMRSPVPEAKKKERNEILRRIGKEKNYRFRKMHEGSECSAVIEDKIDAKTGLYTGLTDNYIRVCVQGAQNGHSGQKTRVRVSVVEKDNTFAEIL